MTHLESSPKNNEETRSFENKERFSVEKWKLSREILLKTKDVIGETEKTEQKKADKFLAREWKSLDENAETITNTDIKHTETLIAEIEKKFPELKLFAAEQYS